MIRLGKEGGFGLSSFLLTLSLSLIVMTSAYALYSNNSNKRVELNYSLNERVRALRDSALLYFVSECKFGEVTVDELLPFTGSESLGLSLYGVDETEMYIKELPRPHFQIDLRFYQMDQIIINSLIVGNGVVSADGLSVTVKLPLTFSHSSSGAFLYRDNHLNSQSICS